MKWVKGDDKKGSFYFQVPDASDYNLQELVVPSHVHDFMEVSFHNNLDASSLTAGESFRGQIDYKKTVRSLRVDVDADKGGYRGIFDTGAQSLCVHQGLPKSEGWIKVGESVVSGAIGSTTVGIYRCHFTLVFDDGAKVFVKSANCFEVPLPGETDVLVGQPIIKLFEFKVWKDFKGLTVSA